MRSAIQHVSHVEFPKFKARQCYMAGMSLATLDKQGLGDYTDVIRTMMAAVDIRGTERFFVTIDEQHLQPGQTQRRGGAHIDGNWIEPAGARFNKDWVNTPALHVDTLPRWITNGDNIGGMLVAASEAASVAWKGVVEGAPGEGGDCEHLRDQLAQLQVVPMLHNRVYLANSTCIHESLPVQRPVKRQLIRITLPHTLKVL